MQNENEVGVRIGSRVYRASVWDALGGKGKVLCANCGHITGKLATEIDHSIPLWIGGYDVLSNCRPYCSECHNLKTTMEQSSIRYRQRVEKGQHTGRGKGGRPRGALPENYEDLLEKYVRCRISRERLAKEMNLQATARNKDGEKHFNNLVHLTEQVWYQEYLDKLGIEKVVNKVGRTTQEFHKKGIVGYIVYKTGEKEYIYETA